MENKENTSPNNDDKDLERKLNSEILGERMKEGFKEAEDILEKAINIVKKIDEKSGE